MVFPDEFPPLRPVVEDEVALGSCRGDHRRTTMTLFGTKSREVFCFTKSHVRVTLVMADVDGPHVTLLVLFWLALVLLPSSIRNCGSTPRKLLELTSPAPVLLIPAVATKGCSKSQLEILEGVSVMMV